ncbi:MAG: Bifunctional uridylyltransferase/uridylyl-removing enzyme [Cellvibrionales bacterium UBA7375]|nr:MAG: Bifunctional uridylyltransferase/uridylyl-removing enzyme [Cellvibrionales bacterium UBA7375]
MPSITSDQPLQPTNRAPIFFDQKRFVTDLESQNPINVFRDALSAAKNHFDNRFLEGEDARALVNEASQFADVLLWYAWHQYDWDENVSLVAVGGYGRGELHPHSDIDLLILMRKAFSKKYRERIEMFITFLWDIQLKIGHSVRSISQCVDEAKSDISVATNLMETRLVCGNSDLLQLMLKKTGEKKIWRSAKFYKGKIDEQIARHHKHQDTEYNLEPNLKEAPGGLRDIHLINWTAKRHFDLHRRSQLVYQGFLLEEEYLTLRKDEEFLWKVRYGLHYLAERPEERLLFDHQRKLAAMLGYSDSKDKLAVEKFMQRYYQTVLSIRELTDVLQQYLDEAIYRKNKIKVIKQVNERFVIKDDYLDTIDDDLFTKHPSALLELFVILGETESLKGIRASAIRQLRLHRKLINKGFREDPVNRELFMRFLRSPFKLSTHLKLMNRYGILGSYLPEFGKIVGQTQHDLFHIYPVDVHTLELITNIRRLVQPKQAAKFPVSAHIYNNLPKPELIIIAALYHDIAKGRGGDHSILGAVDVAEFGERHGLQTQEISLLQWLIENHLLMSTISQREDTSDPDVIYKFAKHVGDQRHLDHLWVLTVADINATNPRLWTEWKGALMSNLYFETKQVLQSGLDQPTNRDAWVNDAKSSVLKILHQHSIDKKQAIKVWGDVDDQFFLRERAEDIAFFTKGIIDGVDNQPIIQIRDVGVEIPVATQIFLHTKSTKNLFAMIAAVLDRLGLSIQDARLQTTSDNRTFDVFYVLDDKDLPVGNNKKLCKNIIDNLTAAIKSPEKINLNVSRRTSRQLKNFTMKTKVTLRNDSETDTSVLQVITPDRPGLLAHIANIFSRFDLVLYNAKISTLGERVEDTFYLMTQNNQPIDDEALGEKIKQTIRNELDSRIKESEQEPNFQSIKIGR